MLEVNKEELMKNTYVVSDIHGRGNLLKEMVDECMDLKEDRLILLGDYIDEMKILILIKHFVIFMIFQKNILSMSLF